MRYAGFIIVPACLFFSMLFSAADSSADSLFRRPAPGDGQAIYLSGKPGAGNETLPSLCKKPETIIFNCKIKKNFVSVCYGKDNGAGLEYTQYRHGDQKKIDLIFPEFIQEKSNNISTSSTEYAGGGERHLKFIRNGYEYILYDRARRSELRDGFGYLRLSSGLVIKKDGKIVSNQSCDDHSGVDNLASKVLPEVPFVPIKSDPLLDDSLHP